MPFEEHDTSISLHTPYQVTKLIGELYCEIGQGYVKSKKQLLALEDPILDGFE